MRRRLRIVEVEVERFAVRVGREVRLDRFGVDGHEHDERDALELVDRGAVVLALTGIADGCVPSALRQVVSARIRC